MKENDAKIINSYGIQISEAATFEEMKNVAIALLAHVSYLLGKENSYDSNGSIQRDKPCV